MIYLVKFEAGRKGSVLIKIRKWVCLPEKGGPQPKPGETWMVEIIKPAIANNKIRHLRLIKQLDNISINRKLVGRIDLKSGLLYFFNGSFPVNITIPLEDTSYASMWADYNFLLANPNAVIIREGKAIFWHKKGKPPREISLDRFATKYKRQPLVGNQEEINAFLNSLKDLRRQVILKRLVNN